MRNTKKEPASGFLALLSNLTRNTSLFHGINTIQKLSEFTEKAILKIHGIGKASLPTFRKSLEEYWLTFKPNNERNNKKNSKNKCIVDMNGLISFNAFLTRYPEQVLSNAKRVREIFLKNPPEIQEEIDFPAKMIAYSYGPKYADMICTIIPSQKGLKLGFYKGVDLPDPENILKGNGKLSRYVEIKTRGDINTKALATLLNETYVAYKSRRIL